MVMTTKKEKTLLLQGVRMPSSRLGGDTVPVPPRSSSYDGPSGVLWASTPEEGAIARNLRSMEAPLTSGSKSKPSIISMKKAYVKATRIDEGRQQATSSVNSTSRDSSPNPQKMCTDVPSENDSSISEASMTKRKRGRPATPGDYVGLAEAKRRAIEMEKAEMVWKKHKAFLEGEFDYEKSVTLQRKERLFTEKKIDYLKNQPQTDIRARVLEYMDQIAGIPKVCEKPMKGGLQRVLNEAIWSTKAAMSIFSDREMAGVDDENVLLINRVRELEGQINELKLVIEDLKRSKVKSPTIGTQDVAQPSLSRGRSKAKVTRRSSRPSPSTSNERRVSWSKEKVEERAPSPPRKSGTPSISRNEPINLAHLEERIVERIMTSLEDRLRTVIESRLGFIQARPAEEGIHKQTAETEPAAVVPKQGEWNNTKKRQRKKKKSLATLERERLQRRILSPGPSSLPKKGKKLSKAAAVTLTAMDGKYEEPMLLARQKVIPKDLGIDSLRVKRSVTGGYTG